MFLLPLTAGLLAGLASTPHCAAMCGPLASFACRGAERGRGRRTLRYHLGRVVAYVAIGAVAGAFGATTLAGLGVGGPWASAILSWALAGALAASAIRLVRARRAAADAGDALVPVRPRRGLRARVLAVLPRGPFALGVATALLPCGALAGALVIAASSGDPMAGSLVLAGFGLSSAAGLVAIGALVGKLLRGGARARGAVAAVLAVGALVLVARPVPALMASPDEPAPACHGGAR